MMAAVDEGVGMIFEALEETGELDNTFILFLGDNGYFFGEHGLGPERRFAYEEGIRAPSSCAFRSASRPARGCSELVLCQDIAPTLIELAGGKPGQADPGTVAAAALRGAERSGGWRKSILLEYWAENAYPWLVNMTYKAVRTERHKYIHWVNRSRERRARRAVRSRQAIRTRSSTSTTRAHTGRVREKLQRELKRLTVEALGCKLSRCSIVTAK